MSFARLMELFVFGRKVCGSSVVTFAAKNIDKLIVGGTLGPAFLGLYSLCQNVILNPSQLILGAVGSFSFPFFSRISASNREKYLSELNQLIALPALFIVGVLSARIPDIAAFFDNFQLRCIWGFRRMPVFAASGVLVSICGPILKAIGSVGWLFRFAVVVGSFNITAVAVLSNFYGIREVFVGLALVQLVGYHG